MLICFIVFATTDWQESPPLPGSWGSLRDNQTQIMAKRMGIHLQLMGVASRKSEFEFEPVSSMELGVGAQGVGIL